MRRMDSAFDLRLLCFCVWRCSLMDNNYGNAPAAMGMSGGFDQDTLVRCFSSFTILLLDDT